MHRSRRRNIEAPGRLRNDEHHGLGQQFAPDEDFLLIAAGEGADGGPRSRRTHIVVANKILGALAGNPPADPHAYRQRPLAIIAQQHVVDHVELRNQAHAKPIFRHETQSGA